eukprot:122853-Chlamydomonas_euryale.AAC.1
MAGRDWQRGEGRVWAKPDAAWELVDLAELPPDMFPGLMESTSTQPNPACLIFPCPTQPNPSIPARPSPTQRSPAQPSPVQPNPAQSNLAKSSPLLPSPTQSSPAQHSTAQPNSAQPNPAQHSTAQSIATHPGPHPSWMRLIRSPTACDFSHVPPSVTPVTSPMCLPSGVQPPCQKLAHANYQFACSTHTLHHTYICSARFASVAL